MKKLISKVLTVVLVCTIASANAQWAKKADFVNFNTLGEGFSINGKGYVCGGSSEGLVMYDPVTDTWTRKTRFPAIGTFNNAYSFVIGDKAYFGIDDSLYEYNSITDTWAIKNVQPFRYRFGSKGFSINNKGYLVGGYDYSPGNKSVYFYEYDPATDTWTRKADVPIPTGKDLLNPRTLVYNGKAYIHGYDLMSYDPATDVWTTEPLPSCNPKFAQVYSCVVGDYFVGGYNKFAKINMVTKQYDVPQK